MAKVICASQQQFFALTQKCPTVHSKLMLGGAKRLFTLAFCLPLLVQGMWGGGLSWWGSHLARRQERGRGKIALGPRLRRAAAVSACGQRRGRDGPVPPGPAGGSPHPPSVGLSGVGLTLRPPCIVAALAWLCPPLAGGSWRRHPAAQRGACDPVCDLCMTCVYLAPTNPHPTPSHRGRCSGPCRKKPSDLKCPTSGFTATFVIMANAIHQMSSIFQMTLN